MTDHQARNTMKIIDAIRATWGISSCIQVGRQGQWRVVNPRPLDPRHAAPTFVPPTLADSNVQPQLDRLKYTIGWDMELYEKHQTAERERRKADDERRQRTLWEKAENMRKAAEAAAEALAQQETHPSHIEEDTITDTDTLDPEEIRRRARQLAAPANRIGENRVTVMDMDPGFAAELLRHNREYDPSVARSGEQRRTNRPQHSDDLLNSWATDMVQRRWVLTHQGIALDRDGYILDGQNRLKALVRAGQIDPTVTIPVMVSYDWDPERFAFLDQGRNRTLTDLYALVGESNRNHLAAVARMCYAYEQGLIQNSDNWRRTRISSDVLLKYTEANHADLHDAVNSALSLRNIRLMVSGAGPALFVIRRAWPLRDGEAGTDADVHAKFLNGLRTGTYEDNGMIYPLGEKDPRRALRNHLETAAASRNRNRRHHMALVIKTWNLWVLRRQVGLIRLDAEFPQPLGREPETGE